MAITIPTPVPALATALPDPSDRTTYGPRGRAVWDWEANQLVPGINAASDAAYANALAAADGALAANSTANFRGSWASLTGALAKPAAVWHSGTVWTLLPDNLADVTASEPGVSADWVNIGGVKRTGDVMVGPLEVPSGAAGAEVPQAQEVALLASTRFGYRNRLINGGFDVFQRDHLTSVGDDAYFLDRWYVLTESGSVTVAQLTGADSGAPFGIRLTQPSVSAKRMGFAQIIESKNTRQFASQAMNLSARLRLSTGAAIRYAVIEHTGTADVVTSDVVNNWASTTFTPSNFFISGLNILRTGTITPGAAIWGTVDEWAALGAGVKNVIVFVWTASAVAQNVTLDCSRIQYEPGVVATPHEWRINELALCAPYARWNGALAGWSFSTISVTGLAVDFGSDPMRSAPSASLLFGTGAIHDVGTAFRNASALGTALTAWGGYMACTTTTTTINKFHNLLAGTVLFEAEL